MWTPAVAPNSPAHMRLVFLVSNASNLTPTWTTVHLAQAALEQGYSVRFCESRDLEVDRRGRLVARAWCPDDPGISISALATALSEGRLPRRHLQLSRSDVVLSRINPLRMAELSFLLRLKQLGVTIINDPEGMAISRSKGWLASLEGVPIPRTLVTHSKGAARAFADHLGGRVVVKPAVGSGGHGVRLVPAGRPRELERALHLASLYRDSPIVVQEYVKEADEGEKRLFWVDGLVVGAYLRRRPPDGFRHNLKQGGQPHPTRVDRLDRAISRAIGPHLRRNGIRIAGLDVMGGKLIEVNTLNPGGIHHAERLRDSPGPRIAGEALRRLLEPQQPADKDAVDETTHQSQSQEVHAG